MIKSKTPRFRDEQGNLVDDSIASLEKMMIGGVNQYVLMRGKSKNAPILLFLHGGPGSAQIGFAPKLQKKLEESFVVVNWDQRGSGKSYSADISRETMNIKQFTTDVYELIITLLSRFNQEKVYLVGHSWGSFLGIITAYKYPELIHAYIGVGQIVNMERGENVSYQFTLDKAKETNNIKAITQLENIGEPPFENLMKLRIQRKWLEKFGGTVHKSTFPKLALKSFTLREYTMLDWVRTIKDGILFSLDNLWEELLEVDMYDLALKFEIPMYFCVGRYDYQTPHELVQEYYHSIEAPTKELVWFENSAHSPNFEEPNKFYDVCLSAVQ
ncbi:alpha/beta hydrolase [Cytobacillus sp. IB215316]|uniref:alpha/beta fold hydrolase n=1 Tax=Cytobacillus sp. IB215316 TaxID=3097354 RepID=UPI002A0E2C53|nr:alpha/beta hydrolase [Cytobacillus sp. IB215316]MDX8360121.1 alpha/beta hydrolase [Cytobacillus sp. IB215316]